PPVRASAPPAGVSVTDATGVRVTFATAPQRIVSLAPSHTETLFAMGLGSRVIAVEKHSDFPPEAARRAQLDCWPRPPLERLVALRPDLVLCLIEADDTIEQMRAARLTVLKLAPATFE